MPFLVLSLLLLVSMSGAQPQAPAYREYETAASLARVSLISEVEAPVVADGVADSAPSHIAAIADFASLAGIDRDHDALLEVYLINKHSGEELSFPLKYSQAREFLILHPMDFQDESLDERNVALLRALAGELHVRMLGAPEGGGKE